MSHPKVQMSAYEKALNILNELPPGAARVMYEAFEEIKKRAEVAERELGLLRAWYNGTEAEIESLRRAMVCPDDGQPHFCPKCDRSVTP
jgi:hypothetical protein